MTTPNQPVLTKPYERGPNPHKIKGGYSKASVANRQSTSKQNALLRDLGYQGPKLTLIEASDEIGFLLRKRPTAASNDLRNGKTRTGIRVNP